MEIEETENTKVKENFLLKRSHEEIALSDWLENLLYSPSINDKLYNPKKILIKELNFPKKYKNFIPGRNRAISFSDQKFKFPKTNAFRLTSNRMKAIHSFANHELMAIEIMAMSLLKFQPSDKDLITKMVAAIREEQEHLALYIHLMNQNGVEFGNYPLNDFFWKQFSNVENLNQYFALMSLTFESANLDFMIYFMEIFKKHDDIESVKVFGKVLKDEISHVMLGFEHLQPQTTNLWNFYQDLLPWPMTPARSKGINFNLNIRKKAISDQEFLESLAEYDDSYRITKRKN